MTTTRETSAYIRQNIQCYGVDAREAAPRRAYDRRAGSDHWDTAYPATPGNIHESHALTRAAGGDGRWLRTPESRRTSGESSSDLPAWLRAGMLSVEG